MTDAPIDVEQMQADIAAGTAGPWPLETVKTSCGVCHKVGQFPSKDGRKGYSYACIYEDYPWSTPFRASQEESNAKRIARLPDLEAAYLALLAENEALRNPVTPKGAWTAELWADGSSAVGAMNVVAGDTVIAADIPTADAHRIAKAYNDLRDAGDALAQNAKILVSRPVSPATGGRVVLEVDINAVKSALTAYRNATGDA